MTPDTRSGLREEARAYAQAWLTGTSADVDAAAGSRCGTASPKADDEDFESVRGSIRRVTGVDLDSIEIRDVAIRSFTSSSAEAAVQYRLPIARSGDDNWIRYMYADGRWNVADCGEWPPIDGFS